MGVGNSSRPAVRRNSRSPRRLGSALRILDVDRPQNKVQSRTRQWRGGGGGDGVGLARRVRRYASPEPSRRRPRTANPTHLNEIVPDVESDLQSATKGHDHLRESVLDLGVTRKAEVSVGPHEVREAAELPRDLVVEGAEDVGGQQDVRTARVHDRAAVPVARQVVGGKGQRDAADLSDRRQRGSPPTRTRGYCAAYHGTAGH